LLGKAAAPCVSVVDASVGAVPHSFTRRFGAPTVGACRPPRLLLPLADWLLDSGASLEAQNAEAPELKEGPGNKGRGSRDPAPTGAAASAAAVEPRPCTLAWAVFC